MELDGHGWPAAGESSIPGEAVGRARVRGVGEGVRGVCELRVDLKSMVGIEQIWSENVVCSGSATATPQLSRLFSTISLLPAIAAMWWSKAAATMLETDC